MGKRLLPATLTWLCEPHETVQSVLGPNARVRLFGSGTNDSAKADDIDLLVESNTVIEQPAPVAARMGALLQWAAGNQRIDGLIAAPMGPRKPFIRSHGPAASSCAPGAPGRRGQVLGRRGQVLHFALTPLTWSPLMSRPLRIEFPCAIYHATLRGDWREPIFVDDGDRHALLAAVAETMDRFNAAVLAYCMVGKHCHFGLHTHRSNRSRLMRHLNLKNGSYAGATSIGEGVGRAV